MALLRLIVVACVGCHQAAEAGPGAALTPPAGWQAMPTLAAAATEAVRGDGLRVDRSEAWGDPARGCYATWLALAGAGTSVEGQADALLAGLAHEPALAGIVLSDVVKPAADAAGGTLSLAFARAPYHGRLRAVLGRDGTIAALACFWNPREPAACDAACAQLVGSQR